MGAKREYSGDESAYNSIVVRYDLNEDLNHHVMRSCVICGFLVHESSDNRPGKKPLLEVIPMELSGVDHCPKCTEVAHRNPEIFSWVINVIKSHHRAWHDLPFADTPKMDKKPEDSANAH